ncbi:MAG TPA: AAA family ATPase [Nitrospira sp.]|nr:AAA family ATPase [Nitrospira sp.]
MPTEVDERLERAQVIRDHEQHPRVQEAERALEAAISTKDWYQQAGQYIPKRQQFHQTIIEGLRNPRSDRGALEPPIVRLVIGHRGSGRTTLIRHMPDTNQFTIVSLERIMQCLPEYTPETALATYLEALDLLHEIVLDLAERRASFILESLGYDRESLTRICEAFKARGFRIELSFVDVPALKAAKRAHASFLRGHGPYVPTYLILDGAIDEHLGALADRLST